MVFKHSQKDCESDDSVNYEKNSIGMWYFFVFNGVLMIILQFPMWVHVAYYQYTSIQRIWDALVAVLVLFCADMGLGFFSASFWLVSWFSWLFLFYFNFLVLGLSTPVVLDLWFLLDIYFEFCCCRWTPYGNTKCIICKQQVHQDAKYCHTCAYSKGAITCHFLSCYFNIFYDFFNF